MAKEFPITFKYKEAAYSAKVITQFNDDEVTFCIEGNEAPLDDLLPGGTVKAVYDPETGLLKEPEQYKGYADVVDSIFEVVKAHALNKRPASLWS